MKKIKKKTSLGANQYKPDPRQALFLSSYLDPKSKTFGNAYQSAIGAGYSDEYAKVMTAPSKEVTWVSENVNSMNMLQRAERNLGQTLDIDIEEQVMGTFGPLFDKFGKPFMKRNPKILAIKHDASKFIAETIGKIRYSKRSEVTGRDGKDLFIPPDVDRQQKDRIKSLL